MSAIWFMLLLIYIVMNYICLVECQLARFRHSHINAARVTGPLWVSWHIRKISSAIPNLTTAAYSGRFVEHLSHILQRISLLVFSWERLVLTCARSTHCTLVNNDMAYTDHKLQRISEIWASKNITNITAAKSVYGQTAWYNLTKTVSQSKKL